MGTNTMINLSKLLTCLIVAFSLFPSLRAEDAAKADPIVLIQPDHKNGVYKTGETIIFTITVSKSGVLLTDGKIDYDLLIDGVKSSSGTMALSKRGVMVSSKLTKPATLRIEVSYMDSGKVIKGKVGVIADPYEIKPALAAPADFEEFWKKQKKLLAAIPMNPKMTSVDQSPEHMDSGLPLECYDLQLDCLDGKQVHAYFAKPINAKPRSLPAILNLPSGGIKGASRRAAMNGAKKNMLSIDMNAFGVLNGQVESYYQGLATGELKDWKTLGINSPQTFHFLWVYMRMVRAIEFLAAQPEWDGKTLIVTGGSQGAGMALVAGGLDDRVSEIQASEPGFCDLTGYLLDRQSVWSYKKPEERTLAYYDACNFVPEIKNAKVFVEVGLVDTTCPASGVLAAYNRLICPKNIKIIPLGGHGNLSPADLKDPDYSHSSSSH